MNRYFNALIVMVITAMLAVACKTNKTDETSSDKSNKEDNVVAEANVEGEAYLNSIDLNDSLYTANSLFYSREVNGQTEWIEVIMSLNDSNQIVKMKEQFVVAGYDAIFSNHFYYKDGLKYATKQFFMESVADSSYFVELLSYYDENEEVLATKRRTAVYEEYLPQEQYMVAEKTACSADRAKDVINQKGKFETTFQGFVNMEGFKFLVVGENAKNGYSSALIVQQITPLIIELRNNESKMIGTPLTVNFQTIVDGTGSQQILLGVNKK